MRIRLDPFIVALVGTALLASALPAHGEALSVLQDVSKVAIGLLFFLYGARLSTQEALAGLRHGRLHGAILASTFVLFPVLGLLLQTLRHSVLTPELAHGVLLLCLVPSTVQSSVAFTSIAGGNVAGAVVSASLSNFLGVFVTPLLVALLMSGSGGAHVDASAIVSIVLQLCVPFLLGQLVRPVVGRWITAHARPLKVVDRGSILLIVYAAFSEGKNQHVWSSLDAGHLVGLAVVAAGLLAVVLTATTQGGRLLGFDRADRTALTFCGSKKSLASGLPMATVMFSPDKVALIVLPLMLFHQLQLIVCAWLATHWPPPQTQVEGRRGPRSAP